MQLPVLATAGLEHALNALLKLDPGATQKLAKLHGQVVAIDLQGLQLQLYFIADESGQLQVLGQHDGDADTTISGSPFNLIRATSSHEGTAQLFSGEMTITGNTELAHKFSAILGGMDIDWEEQLSRFSGDITAHLVGKTVRNGLAGIHKNAHTLEQNLGEYLTEEARLLPSHLETDDFLSQVDALRDDVERIDARLNLIQQQLERSS